MSRMMFLIERSISTGLICSFSVGTLPAGKNVSRIAWARWNWPRLPVSVPSGAPSVGLSRVARRVAVDRIAAGDGLLAELAHLRANLAAQVLAHHHLRDACAAVA